LLHHDRVLLTPHIAGVTHEGKYKMADVLATKILHLFPNGYDLNAPALIVCAITALRLHAPEEPAS
jgi:phosphoglycerate dehydrogenase-like enzyme